MPNPIIIATWSFGRTAAIAGMAAFRQGASVLDAAIAGAQAVEDDPTVRSVGYGGLGDALGNVTLDACLMDGNTLESGAVAGVGTIRHVSALAKRVMENTPHLLLVGRGAEDFARQQGFTPEPLHTPESLAEWERKRPTSAVTWHSGGGLPPIADDCHDTVTVLARDAEGHLAGVCSTSGLPYKLPGRVGDSPIIGAGLYVDDEAGAAGATGVGEEVLRIAGSSLIVEAMRGGASAQEACEKAVKRLHEVARRRGKGTANVAFLAIDRHGGIGAACSLGTDFPYAVAIGDTLEMRQGKER